MLFKQLIGYFFIFKQIWYEDEEDKRLEDFKEKKTKIKYKIKFMLQVSYYIY